VGCFIDQCLQFVSNPDFNDEGFVVVDQYFHRIKIKSAKYIAFSLVKERANNKEILLSCVIKNEVDEFLVYFPEYQDRVKRL